MAVTSEMVKALREKTGLPMMECKKALEESGGDEAAAIELLRKKGIAQVGKRAERVTSEGRIFLHRDDATGRVAMVELLCETAPVADTEDFVKLGRAGVQAAAKLGTTAAEQILDQPAADAPGRKVSDLLHDAVNRIRENIRFGRIACGSGNIGHYIHHDGKKGVLVEFSGPCPDALRADVCMHITAMRPACTRREEVDPTLVETERRIAREQAAGKPAAILDKIVEGKINRWFSETVLLEQPFVKEEKKSVTQIMKEQAPGVTVQGFHRFEIGGA